MRIRVVFGMMGRNLASSRRVLGVITLAMTVRVCDQEVSDMGLRWDRCDERGKSLKEICMLRRESFEVNYAVLEMV